MIITVLDGPDGGQFPQPVFISPFTIRFEDVMGIVAIAELLSRFCKFYFSVFASFEPGVALLFTVRLT